MKRTLNIAVSLVIVTLAIVDGVLIAQSFGKLPQLPGVPEPSTAPEPELQVETLQSLEPIEPKEIEIVIPEPKAPPFTVQAPLGVWRSPWNNMAEEASIWMAMAAVNGEEKPALGELSNQLLEINAFSDNVQISAEQVKDLIQNEFQYPKAFLTDNLIQFDQILEDGNLIIVPVNGQILDSPFYGDPGPEYHMILLYAQDEENYIYHDPGTRFGAANEAPKQKILESIQDLDGNSRGVVIILP